MYTVYVGARLRRYLVYTVALAPLAWAQRHTYVLHHLCAQVEVDCLYNFCLHSMYTILN